MPNILVEPLTGKHTSLRELHGTDIELHNFVLDVVRNAKGLKDTDVTRVIIDGDIEQTMEGASQVSITLHDPDGDILNSGMFERTVDVNVDGLRYRLCTVARNDDETSLTFEDYNVAILRGHKAVVKATRGKWTRAQFVIYLVKRSKASRRLGIVCPELNKKQPFKSDKKEIKKRKRAAGIVDDGSLKVWYAPNVGKKATNAQIEIAETILDVGTSMHATEKVLRSAVATGMVESGLQNLDHGDRDSLGVFQQRPSQGWGTPDEVQDVEHAARSYFQKAILYDRTTKGLSIGDLAQKVQGSAHPEKYAKADKFGQKFVENYGAASVSTISFRKKYQFSTENDGKAEDWWTAIKRVMDDVEWAVFMSNGVLYVIAEEDLMKSEVRMRIRPNENGVDRVNFTYDVGQPIAAATVTCRAERWIAPPGTVVELLDSGPATGRWLVSSVRRPIFSRDTTIELKKSNHSLKEPKSELVDRQNADTDVSSHGGSTRGSHGKVTNVPNTGGSLVYPLEIHGKSLGGVAAHGARPFGNWQSDNAVDIGVPQGTAVYAVADGEITRLGGSWDGTGNSNPNGWNVTLDQGERIWFYTHLRYRNPKIQVGSKVKAGDWLGSSGAANGVAHLHIGVNVGDPERLLKV